jgi:hypothetical protein
VRALDVLIIGDMVHDLPPGCNLKNSSPPIKSRLPERTSGEPGGRQQQIALSPFSSFL